jgi:Flp pilus assembly protein TadG
MSQANDSERPNGLRPVNILGRCRFIRGQSAVELAFAVPVLVLLLVIGSDYGRIFYASIGVNSAARAGAQYGSQTVITAADSTGMVSAAKTDGSNLLNLTATASQCTCATSTTVAACPTNYCTNAPQGTFVEVDTQSVFHTILNYPGIPTSTTLSGKAIMQVQQ